MSGFMYNPGMPVFIAQPGGKQFYMIPQQQQQPVMQTAFIAQGGAPFQQQPQPSIQYLVQSPPPPPPGGMNVPQGASPQYFVPYGQTGQPAAAAAPQQYFVAMPPNGAAPVPMVYAPVGHLASTSPSMVPQQQHVAAQMALPPAKRTGGYSIALPQMAAMPPTQQAQQQAFHASPALHPHRPPPSYQSATGGTKASSESTSATSRAPREGGNPASSYDSQDLASGSFDVIVCRHYLEGKCNRRKCRFKHTPSPQSSMAITTQTDSHSAASPEELAAAAEESSVVALLHRLQFVSEEDEDPLEQPLQL